MPTIRIAGSITAPTCRSSRMYPGAECRCCRSRCRRSTPRSLRPRPRLARLRDEVCWCSERFLHAHMAFAFRPGSGVGARVRCLGGRRAVPLRPRRAQDFQARLPPPDGRCRPGSTTPRAGRRRCALAHTGARRSRSRLLAGRRVHQALGAVRVSPPPTRIGCRSPWTAGAAPRTQWHAIRARIRRRARRPFDSRRWSLP